MLSGPTTLLSTLSLPELTDLIRRNFTIVNQRVARNAAELFINDMVGPNSGNSKRYNEVDTQTFARLKREGQNAVKAQAGLGYEKTATAKRIAIEIDITWEMRRYNRDQEIVTAMTTLAEFCPSRQDLDLTHVFTFSNATSYVDMDGATVDNSGGDGLSIINTAHTLAFSPITWSNRVSGDPIFSQGALEAAERLTTTDILNNFGDRRVLNFNTIITGDDPTTCRLVRQILESTADVDAVQAGIVNTYKGKYMHKVLPFLASTATGAKDTTKRQWWFLGAVGQGQMGWQSYYSLYEPANLLTPAPGNNGDNIHNDDWTFGARMAYSIATVTGRGLIGSLPTS